MAVIHDDVFDAACAVVATSTHCEVRNSASAILVSIGNSSPAITLNAGNFTSSQDGATGRKVTCLVSSTSDMLAIDVSSAGSADKVAIGTSSTSTLVPLVIASLSGSVGLAASDQINLGSFSVTFADP
jgi:hypothetical protein